MPIFELLSCGPIQSTRGQHQCTQVGREGGRERQREIKQETYQLSVDVDRTLGWVEEDDEEEEEEERIE